VKFSDIFESDGGIPIYGSSVNQDETPWDESIIFAWVALHPTTIQTQCETSTKYTRCPESEINNQWELVDSQSDLLGQAEENKIITVKKQEDKISSLQEIYNSALDELDKTRSEMSLEEKISNLKLAEVKVKDAEEKLSELFESPDAITVADLEAKINLAKANTKDAEDTLEELYKKDEDEISLARSEIDQAQAVLNDALNDLGHSRIIAPNSGEIIVISIEEGDSVQRGEPIITLVDENYAIVTANFDEIDIMALTVGDEVLVSLDSMPNQNLTGELVEIGDGVSTQGITKFPVEVEIEQPETFELIEGLSANLSVSTLMVRNVLMVPNQAILGTFMNPTVDVFIDDENFESVSVTLGPSDEFWVVIESGLQLDDKVMMKTVSETDPFERLMGRIPRGFGSGFGPPGGGPPGGGR
jgi:RND family efflux transporter MFP subunit